RTGPRRAPALPPPRDGPHPPRRRAGDGLPPRPRDPRLRHGHDRDAHLLDRPVHPRVAGPVRARPALPPQGAPGPRTGQARHELARCRGHACRLGLLGRGDLRAGPPPHRHDQRLLRGGGRHRDAHPPRPPAGGPCQGPHLRSHQAPRRPPGPDRPRAPRWPAPRPPPVRGHSGRHRGGPPRRKGPRRRRGDRGLLLPRRVHDHRRACPRRQGPGHHRRRRHDQPNRRFRLPSDRRRLRHRARPDYPHGGGRAGRKTPHPGAGGPRHGLVRPRRDGRGGAHLPRLARPWPRSRAQLCAGERRRRPHHRLPLRDGPRYADLDHGRHRPRRRDGGPLPPGRGTPVPPRCGDRGPRQDRHPDPWPARTHRSPPRPELHRSGGPGPRRLCRGPLRASHRRGHPPRRPVPQPTPGPRGGLRGDPRLRRHRPRRWPEGGGRRRPLHDAPRPRPRRARGKGCEPRRRRAHPALRRHRRPARRGAGRRRPHPRHHARGHPRHSVPRPQGCDDHRRQPRHRASRGPHPRHRRGHPRGPPRRQGGGAAAAGAGGPPRGLRGRRHQRRAGPGRGACRPRHRDGDRRRHRICRRGPHGRRPARRGERRRPVTRDDPQHPPEPVLGLCLQRRADPGRRRPPLSGERHAPVPRPRSRGHGAVQRLRPYQRPAPARRPPPRGPHRPDQHAHHPRHRL
ncbi:MAG: Lead, cadmium, zinc and mercury transporting ATPase; Copper-translocating P-type ATPase, partial [uncultured Rubellimicrobium sp.]